MHVMEILFLMLREQVRFNNYGEYLAVHNNIFVTVEPQSE